MTTVHVLEIKRSRAIHAKTVLLEAMCLAGSGTLPHSGTGTWPGPWHDRQQQLPRHRSPNNLPARKIYKGK